jgi:hypothetical protein
MVEKSTLMSWLVPDEDDVSYSMAKATEPVPTPTGRAVSLA